MAMLHLVLLALGGAGITNLSKQLTCLGTEMGTARHQRRRGPAERSAVAVGSDTVRHLFNVAFPQAGVGAVLAGLGAIDACFNTGLKLLAIHGVPRLRGGKTNGDRRSPAVLPP